MSRVSPVTAHPSLSSFICNLPCKCLVGLEKKDCKSRQMFFFFAGSPQSVTFSYQPCSVISNSFKIFSCNFSPTIRFTHDSVYMLMQLSPFIPFTPSPNVSTSPCSTPVSPFLPCKQGSSIPLFWIPYICVNRLGWKPLILWASSLLCKPQNEWPATFFFCCAAHLAGS